MAARLLLLTLAALPAAAAAEEIFRELDPGIDFVHFNGMTGRFYMPEINSGGGGMVDFDGDGDLDLYLVQGAPLEPGSAARAPSDRLFRNDLEIAADGSRSLRFTDVTGRSGIDMRGYGMSVAAGDYDDDGWVDLYVASLGPNALLRNRGDGTFEEVAGAGGADDRRWSVPVSWADYDADGWLDLFVGNYVDFGLANHKVCRTSTGAQDYCGPSAYGAVSNRLFRNRGDGGFEDVSIPAGIHQLPGKSLGVVAADFNGDGRLDYYVANDLLPNHLLIQGAGGRFTDQALLAGAAVNVHGKAEASMGVDAGDFDGDGDEDLFMTHLVRETNTLYLNDGSGMFEDTTVRTGLGPPSWRFTSWGSAWFDYDNDGWLEMLIANGEVRVIEELANAGDPYPFHQPNQLFRNTGGGGFEEVTAAAGPAFQRSEVSRAVSVGDLDNDGDTDALVVNNNGPARILINQVGAGAHWVGLRLVGRRGRDMLGTRVELRRPDGSSIWRRVRTDGSFGASHDPRVLIGLGDDLRVDAVRAYWPGGRVEEWTGIAAARYTTLREGTGRRLR